MLLKQNKMYKKIFLLNTIILMGVLCVLQTYFIINIKKNVRDQSLAVLDQITNEASSYLTEIEKSNELMINLLYQSNTEMNDMVLFLETSISDYISNKIDMIYMKRGTDGTDMYDFIKQSFKINTYLEEITLISDKRRDAITFLRDGNARMGEIPEAYIKDNTNKEFYTSEGEIHFVKQIVSQESRKIVGHIITTYQLGDIEKKLKKYGDRIDAYNIHIIDDTNKIIYAKDGNYKGQMILRDYLQSNLIKDGELERKLGSFINLSYHDNNIIVIGQIKKSIAEGIPVMLVLMLFGIGIIIFAFAEYVMYIRFSRLSDRMNHILDAMEKVKMGEFDIELEKEGKGDELDILIENFNYMCHDLKRYIEKSYLLEIEQNKVEIKALQNQINPHFLYNTLESIRMKAIYNGDRQVAKMIYGLAVIFRSQVKEKNIIPLAKELHYCKKYLEIFEYRYENQFTFEVQYDEELLRYQAIKFIIQPIVENYFVHGIRLEDDDNHISIVVEEETSGICIRIEDNGKGMEEEEVDALNNRLKSLEYKDQSIGIMNVQERLVKTYGEAYGISFSTVAAGGLRAIIRIPKIKGDEWDV